MGTIRTTILSPDEIEAIHGASLAILRDTGVVVRQPDVLRLLGEHGAQVDRHQELARLPERLVVDCVAQTGRRYVLYGRDPSRVARFGFGDLNLLSSPGQFGWIDSASGRLRPATLEDTRQAIALGDALPNITVVGSMGQPAEVSEKFREVVLTAELVRGSAKPTRTWVYNGRTARFVLEIYRAVAGGEAALRERPMAEGFLEPISPLQLPRDGLEMLIEFVRAGQPVSIGPMAMTTGTAPGTLAGTLAQENAEILAGLVVTQLLGPGTPVLYGGIPHIMDPRTSICSFGSPEQALMAVGMTQIGRFYGLPVYINVGLTDAKLLDVQAGCEKAATLVLGALAGADLFGHAGICGTDHGASLEWLVADDELMAYVKRIAGGFAVDEGHLAVDVIRTVGPRGNFLTEEHTLRHYRQELWIPDAMWTRDTWASWEAKGRGTMRDRIQDRVRELLATHHAEPLDEAVSQDLDRIVNAARRELAAEPA
jgi:trimethylamine--corrinoid protein Co-methyltransferase